MSGLTGWMSFKRDISEMPAIAATMTETMQKRGPDDEGIWLDNHIFLGHRRLAVIDLVHGQQPMQVQVNGIPQAVISYVGEIYNYQELKKELIHKGRQFKTNSDTEVILHAYLEWGESFVNHLNGMYAFAIWDTKKEQLLLVRDRMGVKPLYYYPLGEEVIFGTEPKAILAHPEAKAVVDIEGLREIFSIVKTPGHAIFKGMFEVKPGTMLKFNREGTSEITYWQLQAHEHTDNLETTIEVVRELLFDIVKRQMGADVPVGTLLSGGLDSSAVSSLAAKVLEDRSLLTFTIDFVEHVEKFSPDAQWADPDTPFAIELAKHINAEHIKVLLDHQDIMDLDVRKKTLHAQDLPISTGDMEYSLYLLCSALRKHVTVALSGEGSDELFGGYTWFHDPEAIALDSFPWHQMFEKGGGIEALRLAGLWDSLQLETYIKYRYEQAKDALPKLHGESELEAKMRQINYLNLTRWGNFLLDRNDRISMAVGLEIRVPFLDHRLTEYVFNIPWAMKNFDGREKSILRAAMRDELPDSILNRKKTPYPATQDIKYEQALRERLKSIIKPNAPILELVPESEINKLLDAPLGAYAFGGPWSARSVLERLVEFDSWVSDYNVTVDLSTR